MPGPMSRTVPEACARTGGIRSADDFCGGVSALVSGWGARLIC